MLREGGRDAFATASERREVQMDKEEDVTQNANPSSSPAREAKGKSCKGCLYYSSILKSKSQNPRCIGISRTLNQVPSYVVGESELEASKEGRNLTDFRYACAGYSVYLDKKDPSANQEDKQAELPFCVGLEVLLDKRTSPAHHGSANHAPAHHGSNPHVPVPAPAHAQRREDGHSFPQPRPYKPPHTPGNEYLNRFIRNANLVASGVARNVNKVGNYIKESLDDILYPYRRRPK